MSNSGKAMHAPADPPPGDEQKHQAQQPVHVRAMPILLQHPPEMKNQQVICKLLCCSKQLLGSATTTSSATGILDAVCINKPNAGERPGSCGPFKWYDRRHNGTADIQGLAGWLRKPEHASLLRSLQLELKRVYVPKTLEPWRVELKARRDEILTQIQPLMSDEELEDLRRLIDEDLWLPPGRGCCCCCDSCGTCTQDNHGGEGSPGCMVDPAQVQAVVDALRGAEAAAAARQQPHPLLRLQSFSCSPASPDILMQLPAAQLTSLSLSWDDADDTYSNMPATAAALAPFTALRSIQFTCNPTGLSGFPPRVLDTFVPGLTAFKQLTRLELSRLSASCSLQHLPGQLQELSVRFRAPPSPGQLDLGHLTALEALTLQLDHAVDRDVAYNFKHPRDAAILTAGAGAVLPASLTSLAVHGIAFAALPQLQALERLRCLSIDACTLSMEQLLQLNGLCTLERLALGHKGFAAAAAAALAWQQLTALKSLDLHLSGKSICKSIAAYHSQVHATVALSTAAVEVMMGGIAAVLSTLSGLQHLSLSGLDCHAKPGEVVKCVRSMTGLQSLAVACEHVHGFDNRAQWDEALQAAADESPQHLQVSIVTVIDEYVPYEEYEDSA